MFRSAVFTMGVCLLLAGSTAARPQASATVWPSDVVNASQVDPATGNLIALWMRAGDTREAVLVTEPHAMFVYWPHPEYEQDSDHKKVFIFCDNVAKKTFQTPNFDAFLKLMAEQPRDISVMPVDSCSVSRWNLPRVERQGLEKVMAHGNRTWAADPNKGEQIIRFCYCNFGDDFLYPAEALKEKR